MEESKYQRLLDDGKEYVRVQMDLLKIELLDKLSRILTMLAVGAIAIVLLLAAFVYLSLALVAWVSPWFNGPAVPLLIVGGLFVLVAVVAFLCRERLFLRPLLRGLIGILFANRQDKPKTVNRPAKLL